MTWWAEYPYEPPEREFADTLLAYRDFVTASMWSVRIEPDPLGDVNRIVTLMCGDRRVKSVLCPASEALTARVGYDPGTPLIRCWSPGWRELAGLPGIDPEPYRPPSWYVEVDGERIIDVPESQTWPPRTPPPRTPLGRRARQAVLRQMRAGADRITGWLGYHRADECGGWDE